MTESDDTDFEVQQDKNEAYRSKQRLAVNPQREIALPMLRVWNAGHYQAVLDCEERSAGADRELIPEPPKAWQRK